MSHRPFTEINACRICGNTRLEPVLSLGEQSLTGVFPAQRDDSLTRGPLELVRCAGNGVCGLLQLRHSYNSEEMYGENYGYRSGLNQSMVRHLRDKVIALCSRVRVETGDVVLDIGSNDGTTLSFYPADLTRVGMDPTASKFLSFYQPGIQVVPDFFSADAFSEKTGGQQAKIITSIAMFYDLERPIEFMKQIERVLHPEGVWHFEQSYMPLMIQHNAYDTICHEHLEYYGFQQIQWMLERCGLKAVSVELNDTNGGSFAVTAAHADSALPVDAAGIESILADERKLGLDRPEIYAAFRERVFRHRDELRALLEKLRGEGRTVFGYGASTKGNVILQFCGVTPELLPYIAEVNPEKYGRHTPGSDIPIISEVEAHARKPDYFLALPWHFRENLLERETVYLRGGGAMIFPLPQIEIVTR